MSKDDRMTAGRTSTFKQIAVAKDHHDQIAMLAIQNDSTMSEEAAKALTFYFAHLAKAKRLRKVEA